MGKGAKSPKGIMKRARISANGKVRFSRTGKQKLNGHERGETLQDRRGYVLVGSAKIKLLEKQLHRRLTPVK
ncbi:MAG: 50S ribosomal protein L35 [Planctomycetota bacterium]